MSLMLEVFNTIKEKNIKFIDFRFADSRGKNHQISYLAENISEEIFELGLMFDGSSIEGWKDISNSDMVIMPDCATAFIDPFTTNPTIVIICDILDSDGKAYNRDPRQTAKRAEAYLSETGIGDKAFFGPELEFFIFDNVTFQNSMNATYTNISAQEGSFISGDNKNKVNSGHNSKVKEAYFTVPPLDSIYEIRAEMLLMLKAVGLTPTLHHHEVAPNQCELGISYGTLVEVADNVQKYKYVIHKVAQAFGKTATFMPKPFKDDNGSGMHIHQSIWKNNKPLFYGEEYANLSQESLYYIGGIIKHAKAINAFTNPTTNSYKRLTPGFEAPVLLAYSSCNRTASIRIPHTHTKEGKRIEVRFPDSTANPYYAFSAMLLAGIDGIKNKIDPGDAKDVNLYELAETDLKGVETVSRSLRQSLEELSSDREFLKQGNVFSDDQIDAYIKIKMKEVEEIEKAPHPLEFSMYYSS